MNTSTLLKKVGIKPEEPVLLITAEEALENILEAVKEYCPHLKIDKMSGKNILSLLNSYADCVIDYHPENYHQERGALTRQAEMLEKYGLTDEDYESLDFC